MFVKSLEFRNFRNLQTSIYYPSEGINVICGNNAQGKTNLIECLWLFTGGRSFRGSKEKDMITFGEESSLIKMNFFSEGRDQDIAVLIEKNKRKASLNGIQKAYLSQIIGKFCAVVFSPDHLTIVKNGPDERRSFIDGALCQVKPVYASMLSRYKKILNERNSLLKEIIKHPELKETMSVWNESLAAVGAKIAVERAGYIRKLDSAAVKFYDGISKGQEKLQLKYKMNCKISDDAKEEEIYLRILELLEKRQDDDIYCGYTTVGIHRDDLGIKINDREAKSFGSQGQQRSAVLSLKLAESAVLGDEKGEKPVILLDDVLSELDLTRQNFLLTKLDGMQVFITCCEKNISTGKVTEMENGRLMQ